MSSDLWIFSSLAGLFGLLIGSFLNVCIYRMPRDLSVVRPRSRCPRCETPIRAWDNIPVLSYLLLRGKCRQCRRPISGRYPLVEITMGLLCAFFVARFGLTALALRDCTLAALMLALIFSDLETRILPEILTFGAIASGLFFSAFVFVGDGTAALLGVTGRAGSILDATLGAIIPAALLWLCGWIYRKIRVEALGFGDVVMLAGIGAFLGLREDLLTLVAASVLGTVLGVAYILINRKSLRTYELPLGSFLGVAAIGVAAFGAISCVGIWDFSTRSCADRRTPLSLSGGAES